MSVDWTQVLLWALALLLGFRLLVGLVTHRSARRRNNVRTMVVLGSGGHTAEMLSLLRGMDLRTYRPRSYVVAATDAMSGAKAAAFEAEAAAAAEAAACRAEATSSDGEDASLSAAADEHAAVRRSPRKATAAATAASEARRRRSPSPSHRLPRKQLQQQGQAQQQGGGAAGAAASDGAAAYSSSVIPRSREVGQPWRSSAVSTARALLFAFAVVLRQRPDLVLVNGPGTCIPVVACAWLLRFLGLAVARVVYVESIARVYRLSLSGKILYHSRMADAFFVQWDELRAKYPRAINAGRLM